MRGAEQLQQHHRVGDGEQQHRAPLTPGRELPDDERHNPEAAQCERVQQHQRHHRVSGHRDGPLQQQRQRAVRGLGVPPERVDAL